jgi:outer membrane receptor protein involved in Fe transport
MQRFPFRRKLLASLVTAALAATWAPSTGWAQTAEAALRGKAPSNSEVSARNLATGAVRRTKAAEDGSYALIGLPPGTYQVDAGPGTQRVVTVTVASTATLDLGTGAPVARGETITVSAAALTEVKTSEVGSTVSLHQIQTIPQISRNFLEFADTVPGMVFSVDEKGHTSLRGGAQNNDAVNVFIDGYGQKNFVKQGGVSGQFFSQGNPFPQLAIGEYKVITSNYKAEYDQVSSAVVSAATKSGTNEFHGEIYGRYTNDSYRRPTPAEEAAGKKTPSKEKEYGFAFGGPIIKDRMHFILTHEVKEFDTPITVTSGVTGVPGLIGALPQNVQSQFGPSDLPFTEHLTFAKVDWSPSAMDLIEVSAKVRREKQRDNVGNTQAQSAAIDVKNDDTRYAARWQHSADRWLNELAVTHEDAFNSPTALNLGNGAIYTYNPPGTGNQNTIVSTAAASPLATQNKGQKGPGIQDDLTFLGLRGMGEHLVKTGVKYKDITLTAQDAENINPQFYYNVSPSGTAATPYRAFFTNPVPGLNPVATAKTKQLGLYVQDDWEVSRQLTLNLGVRWDYERIPSYTNYVTPANVVAALNSRNPDPTAPAGQTYAQALALGGVNVNDYISTGSNRSPYKNEWQPRVGFSFDLTGQERHVIFGGAGRAYDRNLYDYLQLEQTKSSLPQYNVYFQDSNGHCIGNPCVAWDPRFLNGLSNLQSLVASTNTGMEVDMINNHLKTPHSDQFSIGMRNRLADWNTSATLARIISKDGLAFTLGNRFPNGAFWMNGGQPWGNGVPGFGALIIGNNGIETRTTQVLLSAERPYTPASHWGASFAYTYTDATQNRDINEHYAFDAATIHDYPFITSNAAARHRFVAAGAIDGPWQTVFSAKLTLASPIPKNDFACYVNGQHYPSGAGCQAVALTPSGRFGYKSVDLNATKNFEFYRGVLAYVRVDILNAFNNKNYSDYILSGNSTFSNASATYNPTGNITGVPRTFKLMVGLKF